MVGFFVAAPIIIIMISGWKRTAFGFLIAGVVLTPIFLITGIHNDFLDTCLLRRPPAEIKIAPAEIKVAPAEIKIAPAVPKPPHQVDTSGVGSTSPTSTNHPPLTNSIPEIDSTYVSLIGVGDVPKEFFAFSGRIQVWRKALDLSMDSPILGYGFHADRYLLDTHAHNSLVHSLLQTGFLGAVPFMGGLLLAWLLLLRASLNKFLFSNNQKSMFIQIGGMVAFLSVRTTFESTGAFFGVDWLLLGPILIYLQAINFQSVIKSQSATKKRLWGLIPWCSQSKRDI